MSRRTTVPNAVRQALGVDCGDEIVYVVDESGRVNLLAAVEETDPVIDGFLAFLAKDMIRNPSHLAVLPVGLAERMTALTAGMTVDLDEEIDGPVTVPEANPGSGIAAGGHPRHSQRFRNPGSAARPRNDGRHRWHGWACLEFRLEGLAEDVERLQSDPARH